MFAHIFRGVSSEFLFFCVFSMPKGRYVSVHVISCSESIILAYIVHKT